MKIAKITFWVLWRFWFYILMGFLIILMLPLLVISIIKESWYPFFFRLARFWAKGVLLGMGFHIKILEKANNSIQSRANKELFFIFEKK